MKKYLTLALLLISIAIKAQVNSFQIDSSKFIKPLMNTLDSLYQEDQAPRMNYTRAVEEKESAAVIDSLRNVMVQKDKANLAKVQELIAEYGWLSPQKVGMNASQALFLIIQHADLNTQKKFLPIVRDAEERGELLSSNLAIMEDRINVREGRKQLYGSQALRDKETGVLRFYPIADPDRLDERRKSMGLSSMAEYAKLMKMDWDLKAYKRNNP